MIFHFDIHENRPKQPCKMATRIASFTGEEDFDKDAFAYKGRCLHDRLQELPARL